MSPQSLGAIAFRSLWPLCLVSARCSPRRSRPSGHCKERYVCRVCGWSFAGACGGRSHRRRPDLSPCRVNPETGSDGLPNRSAGSRIGSPQTCLGENWIRQGAQRLLPTTTLSDLADSNGETHTGVPVL